jgi:hypothetical protein
VVGEGLPDPEAEMVFSYQGGWLVLVENFRGDLGETPGSPVGNVGGEPAAVYSVNGGVLVQWSHDGRWYGLFGRGVAQEKVVALALMVVYFAVDGGAGRVGYRRNPPIDGGLRKV